MATHGGGSITVLEKLVTDISMCISILREEFDDTASPITDDNTNFQKFCTKLERVLETGRKTRGLFGSEKCYWNYLNQCLAANKAAHDGLKFVKINTDQLKTNIGRGRAFIRFCLTHQSLADTLQQCFMNENVTGEWYSSNSVPCQKKLHSSFIASLYELNEIQFDLSPDLLNLDTGWPIFARKVFTSPMSWQPPSRSVSVTSLNSTMSQGLDTSSSIAEIDDEEKHQLRQDILQLTIAVSDIKTEKEKLLSEINQLQADIQVQEHLKEKIRGLERDNEKVNQECKEAIASWKEEENILMKRLVESEKQASEHFTKYSCCKDQLRISNSEKLSLNESLAQLAKSKNDQEINLKLYEKELSDLKNARYDEQINKLNSKISACMKKIETLTYENENLEEQKKVLMEDCDDKIIQVRELLTNQSLLQDQCSKHKYENKLCAQENLNLRMACDEVKLLAENLADDKTDLLRQLNLLKDKAAAHQDEFEKSQEQVSKLKQANEGSTKRNKNLSGENEDLLSRIESMSKQCSENIDEVKQLTDLHLSLKAQCSKLQLENESVVDENVKLKTVCDEVKSLVENLEKNKSDLIKQLETLESETAQSQEELTKKEDEILNLQHANNELQKNFDATVKNTTEEIDRLKESLMRGCSMCDLNTSRVLSLSDQIELLKKQKNRAELERNELNQKNDLIDREKNELMMESSEKDKSVTKCKTEIGELKKTLNSVDTILRKQETIIDDLGKKLRISLENNVKLNELVKTRQDEVDALCSRDGVTEEDIPLLPLDASDSKEEPYIEENPLSSNDPSPETEFKDGETLETSSVNEDLEVVSTASRTLTRLQSLVEEGKEIHNIVETAKEVSTTMISKVQQQEEKLKYQEEVIELSQSQFDNLQVRHEKLLTSESILRYELKEKRKMLEKLKKQLASSRKRSLASRLLQEQSQAEWDILHEEFANRPKCHSEESELLNDEIKPSNNNADSAIASQSSSTADYAPVLLCSEIPDSSLILPDSSIDPTSSENKQGIDRLKYLEQQCQFLYARLIQSSKKSDYLETKLNQLLGLNNSDGSDTEDNIESITELDVGEVNDPVLTENSSELTSHNTRKSSRSSSEIQGASSNPFDSDENASPTCENTQYLPGNTDFSAQNLFSASEEEIMNESEDDNFVNVHLSHAKTSLELKKSSEILDELPFVDSEQPQIEGHPCSDKLLAEPPSDNIKHGDGSSGLDDVKNLAEIKMGLKMMVGQVKATAAMRDTQAQDLLSENSNLKKLLEKLETEKVELVKKEADIKNQAEIIVKSEKIRLAEKIQVLSAENSEMKETISNLTEKVEDFELAKKDMIQVITFNEESKSQMQKELMTLKSQLGAEAVKCERALKGYAEQELCIVDMKQKILEQEQLIIHFEETLKDIKDGREVEKSNQIHELENLHLALSTRNEECTALTDELKQVTKALDDERNLAIKLKVMLEETKSQNSEYISKLEADLYQQKKDNRDLMDKLIKLIRDKDVLWQKTDRLTDLQKLSIGSRWMNNTETNQCLCCQVQFTFLLRKHHCRLCGQIFCFNCCKNWVMIASSSSKSRVCNTCLINQTALVSEVADNSILDSNSGDTKSEPGKSATNNDFEPLVEGRPRTQSLSTSTSCNIIDSPEEVENNDTGNLSADDTVESSPRGNSSDLVRRCMSAPPFIGVSEGRKNNAEENASQSSDSQSIDEFHVISDEEISKSLSGSNPYMPVNKNDANDRFQAATTKTVFDIEIETEKECFHEVWINAGGRYSIPVLIEEEDIILKWEFMTKPNCIAFGVNYKEIDLVPTDVFTQPLLPIVKCKNSHTSSVFGHVKIRRRGIYILVFDNGFSTIFAKKVKYKLTIHRNN